MAGLLDMFNPEDPQNAGLLAFASQMFNAGAPSRTPISTGQALSGGLGAMQNAMIQAEMLKRKREQDQLEAEMNQMKMGQYKQQIADQEAAKQRAAMLPKLVEQFGDDYQGMIRAGVPQDYVKALAESKNYGRAEVARVEELSGADGSKIKQQFDKFGNRVGDAMNGYVPPQLIDNGRTQGFVIPKAGMSFQKQLSPAEAAAIVDRRAGLNLQERKLQQDESQFNATQGMKQDEKNATKAGQIASFDTMLDSLVRLQNHQGLTRSVGMNSKFPTMPGSDSANFQAELNTFKAQSFIPMVAQLKGMGALSDAEGKKLSDAVGALDYQMSEPAFRASLNRIYKNMKEARDRAANGTNFNKPPASSQKSIDDLLNMYGN